MLLDVILMIVSLVNYWAGMTKEEVQVLLSDWLPIDFDIISLQCLPASPTVGMEPPDLLIF